MKNTTTIITRSTNNLNYQKSPNKISNINNDRQQKNEIINTRRKTYIVSRHTDANPPSNLNKNINGRKLNYP